MEHGLARVEDALRVFRPDYHARLRPALDGGGGGGDGGVGGVGGVGGLIAALPSAPSPDLVALYRWHDGANDGPEPLFGDWSLTPAEIGLSVKHTYDELLDAGEFGADYWRSSWMPILHTGEGELLCVDVDAAGAVVWFSPESSRRRVEFPDLGALIDALADALERHGPRVADDLDHPDGYPSRVPRIEK